jgi:hypothetical protein
MDSLLDTKFGYQDVECCIQDTYNLGLTNDRTETLREIRDEDTKEQMS